MHRLICRGSRTKLETKWDDPSAITHLIALENGTNLGEFPTAAQAKIHAETLLPDNLANIYLVLNEDSSIAYWIYDSREQRRLDRQHGLRNALFTACILAFVTAVAENLLGIPPSSTMGGLLIAVSTALYLFMRTFQNLIESLVAWFLLFVMIMMMLFFWLHKNDRRNHDKSGNGNDQTQVDPKPLRADSRPSWQPTPTARTPSLFSATLKTWPSA